MSNAHPDLCLELEPHPLLDAACFLTRFPTPLEALPSPQWMLELLRTDARAPLESSDEVRGIVRNLLRYGGFKPTGRSKPASEYLIRASTEGTLGSINSAVDVCNVVSLHSGLPVSVVDSARLEGSPRIAIAPVGSHYVFNSSGQEIDVGGLLCLFDAVGPCANAVKDAQRTKTGGSSVHTLSVVWGSLQLPDRTRQATAWYRTLLEALGAQTLDVPLR